MQFATNYLGLFLLTGLLLPKLPDRVVSVSSQLHQMGKVHLDDLNSSQRQYNASAAYSDSKLAGVLFSLGLQRRMDTNLAAGAGPFRSILAHPGIASTNLARQATSGKITHALRVLFNLAGNSYVGPRGLGSVKGHPAVGEAAAAGRDPDTARQLWVATEALLATANSTAAG